MSKRYKLVSMFLLTILFVLSLNTGAFTQDTKNTAYSVDINNFLAFENVIKYNNAYYVPVDNLITFLNAQRDRSKSDDRSVFITGGSSYSCRFEEGPFRVDFDPSSGYFRSYKMIYWNSRPLYVSASVYGNTDYVDLNAFCQRVGYSFNVYINNIDIETNDYSKIRDNARIRLVILPSSTSNVSAVPDKMDTEPFTEDIADPFAKAGYQRLVELFKNIYGDRFDFITINDYLDMKKSAKQTDSAVDILQENIKYGNLTIGMDYSNSKRANVYGGNFVWQQTDLSISGSAKNMFEDILKTENAQGVIYTNIEQVGSNSGYYYDGFYFKYKGFCYLPGGVILPLINDSYNFQSLYYNSTNQTVNGKARYLYYPIYHNKGKLYYIMPLPFIANGFQIGDKVEIVNKDTNEAQITSKDNKTTTIKDMALLLGDKYITIDQYATGMQTGQALAALDECIPQIFDGIYYNLLSNANGGDYAGYLYNFVTVGNVCKLDGSPDFKKMYAELLLKNGFYDYASNYIKENKISTTLPEYTEMLALQALNNGSMTQAENLFKQIMADYQLSGNTGMVNKTNKKIFYLYRTYIRTMDSKKNYAECARTYEYLAGRDPSNARQYYLLEGSYYEKASLLNDAYNIYMKYLNLVKSDSAIEAKAHALAVALGKDDLEIRVRTILQKAGFILSTVKYYITDTNKDGYKDIIVLSNNDIKSLVRNKSGEYPVSLTDKKKDAEILEDIDKDGIPEIVAGRTGISGYSSLKFTDPYLEIIKSRKLFNKNYTEQRSFVKELKSKEAALAKLFYTIGSKNTAEYNLYPQAVKDFIAGSKLDKDKKIITASRKQLSGDTLAVIIQSQSFDKKVEFSYTKAGSSYMVTGIKSVGENKELFTLNMKGLVD